MRALSGPEAVAAICFIAGALLFLGSFMWIFVPALFSRRDFDPPDPPRAMYGGLLLMFVGGVMLMLWLILG